VTAPPDIYDRVVATPEWAADLGALNRTLIDSLQDAGLPAQFGGSPFYRHMQNDSILDGKFTTRDAVKRRRLCEIAQLGRTLFEIGVNGGHGILLQKHANPDLKCTGIDLCQSVGEGNPRADIYCPVAMHWLTARFPGDMDFLIGSSANLLPDYAARHQGSRIDLLRIDGARSLYYSDFMALKPLLHDGSLIVFDDPRWSSTRTAVTRLMAEGLLTPDPRFSDPDHLFISDPVMRLAR